MAGTVRISALTPLTSVTPDDYIIINNANSNTQTVSFDNFVKSVNAVMSVNGYGGPAITLTANDVGSYTTAEVDTLLLGKTDQSTTATLDARVGDNETAIAANTVLAQQGVDDAATANAAVADHEGRIDALETDIDTKLAITDYDAFVLTEFTPVKDRSVANSSAISAAETAIAQNTADIATNLADIATNTADIAQNTADITTNTTDIEALQNTVTGNGDDIADNTADIAGLTTRVDALDTATTGKVPVLEADVATLKTDVLTNTAKGTSNYQLVRALAGSIETAATSVAAGDSVEEAFAKLTTAMGQFLATYPAP